MPFLGANRTALTAGWGPQGPDYRSSVTFPMVMVLNATGVMPKYSVQRDSNDSGISNTNFFDGWTAATIDNTDKASWNRYAMTSIYTLRFPTGWFDGIWSGEFGGSNSFQSNDWRENSASSTFSDGWSIGQDGDGIVTFSYGGSGAFTNTNISGSPGTVTAASLEDRWLSMIFVRGPRTSFSNYNASQGTDTYGCRVYVRDAETGELLYARDMGSFSGWSTNPPDITTYSGTITASDHNSTTTLDWRCDQWSVGSSGSYTGNVDHAQIWLAPGVLIDPATTSDWVSNGIPSTIAGKTAWIHATFSSIQYTNEFGYTYVSTSATDLASQATDKIIVAGGGGNAQLPFTNTIYPGS
jgi:hypothetical protein